MTAPGKPHLSSWPFLNALHFKRHQGGHMLIKENTHGYVLSLISSEGEQASDTHMQLSATQGSKPGDKRSGQAAHWSGQWEKCKITDSSK